MQYKSSLHSATRIGACKEHYALRLGDLDFSVVGGGGHLDWLPVSMLHLPCRNSKHLAMSFHSFSSFFIASPAVLWFSVLTIAFLVW